MRFFINWRAYPFSRLFFATRTSAWPVLASLFSPFLLFRFSSAFRPVSFAPFRRSCKTFCTAVSLRSPAVVFSPLARPLLLSSLVTGFLPQTLSVLLLFSSSFAFSRALFLLFRFGARFSSLLASYAAFQSAFLSAFCPRFSVPLLITLFQKQTAALQHLPLRLFVSILSLFSLMPYFFGTFILLCRVPIRLKESLCPCSFLRSSLAVSSYQRLLWQSRFLRASRPTFPLRASFLRTKKPALPPVLFFLYKLFLYALAFSISSPACSMPWPLSPSPPSSLATSFCRAVSSRRCTRVRVSSFSTVFSIR